MEDVEYSPEILESLWTLLVLHCQDEIKEGFVIHFPFKCLVLLEYSINEDGGQSRRIASQLGLLQHSVLINIKSQILVIYSQT